MKKFITLVVPAVLFLACSAPTNTDRPSKSKQHYAEPIADSVDLGKLQAAFPVIDRIYKDYMDANHFPSIAYGVVVNGKLVHSGGYGLTNVDGNTSTSNSAMYRIASMSKSFTAMAILKLRDEGRLSLTDLVSKYVPEFSKVDALTTDAPSINIQHLMTMAAGFPEDNPWGDRQLGDSEADLIKLISEGLALSNVPGVQFEYSNLGFALLGKIIGKVSGIPYQQYITESIMKPLGMNDARWEYTEVPADKLAHGYRWEDDQWKEEKLEHDGIYGAMGGLICSMDDFSKYVAFHLAAWPPRNEPEAGPVKRSTVREMHQPWRFINIFPNNRNRNGAPCPSVAGYGYGLGWRKDCAGTVRIAHSGGLPGFGSEWRIYPDYGVGVISFANLTYGAPGSANAKAIDTLVYMAGLKPRTSPESAFLDQRKREIVYFMMDWKADTTIFAENFFPDLSLERRKKQVSDLLAQAGGIISVSPVRAENQLRGTFTINCEKKKIEVFFTLTPEARPLVQQLDMWLGD